MKEAISRSLQIRGITPLESMNEAHFFNSSSFLLDKPFDVKGWQLLREGMPVAQVFFYIENGVAISGYQSTFGSFDVRMNVRKEELIWFIIRVFLDLKELKATQVDIRHFPSYWDHYKLLTSVLIEQGFNVKLEEINQHVEISNVSFDEIINRNKRKKINQCIKAEFSFELVDQLMLPQIYKLIVSTRKRKGYSLSMSFELLNKAIGSSPDNYRLFVIKDGQQIIAASVSVVVRKDVLYNFYHADDHKYRNYSPISFLVKQIYDYCFKNNFKILDLGISSLKGILNEDLFNFKRDLGSETSSRNLYTLKL